MRPFPGEEKIGFRCQTASEKGGKALRHQARRVR